MNDSTSTTNQDSTASQYATDLPPGTLLGPDACGSFLLLRPRVGVNADLASWLAEADLVGPRVALEDRAGELDRDPRLASTMLERSLRVALRRVDPFDTHEWIVAVGGEVVAGSR